MKLTDFDYSLPKELIAQYPLKERDAAKLLVINRSEQTITHRIFKDVIDYINKDDLLVLNNTRVIPARLSGKRVTGGKVEVLLLKDKGGLEFEVLIKPARIRANEKIIFNNGSISGIITSRNEIKFQARDINDVYSHGVMPLPPYIKRDVDAADSSFYQTVYAKEPGAVASPTAGLHFTEELLGKITSLGINTAYITLHVGYATFKPVKEEDITKHKMHQEYFSITDEATRLIESTPGRIFAVGTTACRALETYSAGIKSGHTDLFIYPGYKFKAVDALITNFHLPRTTLFMLVCAFAGENLIKKAYQEAIDNKYRFYSYGDAMLII